MNALEKNSAPAARSRRKVRSVDGRVLTHHGIATRDALVDELHELLLTRPWREVCLTVAARKARRSPATFYCYFHDIYEALEAVCARYTDAGKPLPRELARITHQVNGERPGRRRLPDPIAERERDQRRRIAELEEELAAARRAAAKPAAAGRGRAARAEVLAA